MIDLFTLASTLKDEGLEMPLLFRFPDIVNHRLHLLQVSIYHQLSEAVYPTVAAG